MMKKLLVFMLICICLFNVNDVKAENNHVLDREWQFMLSNATPDTYYSDYFSFDYVRTFSFSISEPTIGDHTFVVNCGDNGVTDVDDSTAIGTSGVKAYIDIIKPTDAPPRIINITFYADGSLIKAPQDSSRLFCNPNNLYFVDRIENAQYFDTSDVTNIELIFYSLGSTLTYGDPDPQNCSNIDISSWDKSNITNIHNIFSEACDYNSTGTSIYNLSNWKFNNIDSSKNIFGDGFSSMIPGSSGSFKYIFQNWHVQYDNTLESMFNINTINASNVYFDFSGYTCNKNISPGKIFESTGNAVEFIIPNMTAIFNPNDSTYTYVENSSTSFYLDDTANVKIDRGTNSFTLSYGVKYHLNGGIASVPSKINLNDNDVYALYIKETEFDPDYTDLLTGVTKDGSTFIGWADGDGNPVTSLSTSDWEANYLDLYAVWKSNNTNNNKHFVLNTGIN